MSKSDTLKKSIVQIWVESPHGKREFRGTGFFIEPTTILTCKHVVNKNQHEDAMIPFEESGVITIRIHGDNGNDSQKELPIKSVEHIKQHGDENDIALIRLEQEYQQCEPLPLLFGLHLNDESYDKWLKQNWFSFGFPSGDARKGIEEHPLELGSPLPTACSEELQYPRFFTFKNGISNGCSGSPILLEIDGRWVCFGMIVKGGFGRDVAAGLSTDLMLRKLNEQQIDVSETRLVDPREILKNTNTEIVQIADTDTTILSDDLTNRTANNQDIIITKKVSLNKTFTRVLLLVALFVPIIIGITRTVRVYWPNLRSAEKIEPGFDRVVMFKLKSTANDGMADQINAELRKQLKNYINEQAQQIPCNQNIVINTVEKNIETEEDALRLASRYDPRLVLWGDYTIVANKLSIRTHIWNAGLKRTWKSDSPVPISLDGFLNLPLSSTIGNKAIAIIHFDLAFFALSHELKREAKRHFEEYEKYDLKLSDKKSMYQASQPNTDIQLSVAHAHQSVKDPEAFALIDIGYATCASHDDICKGRFNVLRSCVFSGNGELSAALDTNEFAMTQLEKSGDISDQYIMQCNQADSLERKGRNEEALTKWELCEDGLRQITELSQRNFSTHRKAMLAIGRILRKQRNRVNRERGRMFLVNIYPIWKKDNVYSDALHELAHLDILTSEPDSAQARIHDAIEYIRDDEPVDKRAHLYSLQGEIAYLRKEYPLAASAKRRSVELSRSVGSNPITCDYFVYLDSFHQMRSPSALIEAEVFTSSGSAYNGIRACLSQQALNRKLEICGNRPSAQKS